MSKIETHWQIQSRMKLLFLLRKFGLAKFTGNPLFPFMQHDVIRIKHYKSYK